MGATVSKRAASGLYYKFLVQITVNGFLDNSLVQQFSRLKNMSDIGSTDGSQAIAVRAGARAFVHAAERPVAGEAINIGSGEAGSVLEIAETLANDLDKDIEPYLSGKYRQGDVRHCFADITTARRFMDWTPIRGFRQGVSELVEWVQSQREVHDGVDGAWTELERRGLLS